MTPSNEFDMMFAERMVKHHQMAIEMAKMEGERGKSEEMKKLAEGIIVAQKAEIETMKAWISSHK